MIKETRVLGPNFEDAYKNAQKKLKGIFDGGGGGDNKRGIIFAAAGFLAFWLLSGFFIVDAKEQGVITRFGAYNRSVSPGLNYHIPYPIESLTKVPVTVVSRIEIGMRSSLSGRDGIGERDVPEESLMLTGDENIVDINFEVQWKVGNAKDFLFSVRDPKDTVKDVAESAMREVIGKTPIANALAEGKFVIQQQAKDLLQKTLDNYQSGIEIVALQLRKVDPPAAVIDAFRDVQTARADRERARNEAETYRNDIIPRARGQAEQIIQDSEAYKQKVVAQATGEANRFLAVFEKYRVAKDVTKRRIYLETMEEILNGMDKIMVDTRAQGSGVVPYLPLPELNKGNKGKTQ